MTGLRPRCRRSVGIGDRKAGLIWEGKVQKEGEHLLLIKTLPDKYAAVEKFILERHSYETPEIIALPVNKASSGYLSWLENIL